MVHVVTNGGSFSNKNSKLYMSCKAKVTYYSDRGFEFELNVYSTLYILNYKVSKFVIYKINK